MEQPFEAAGSSYRVQMKNSMWTDPPPECQGKRRRAAAFGVACSVTLMLQGTIKSSADTVDGGKLRLGPRDSATVYWVGHSLIEAKAPTANGEMDLMTLVGTLARAKGLRYEMGDHTLWGSPLSALWRGKPHSYDRDASAMVEKRRQFEAEAGKYDSMVLTEVIPVKRALDNEYSAHYVRRFYCTLKSANPQAQIYLYESWVNLQGGDPHAGYPPAHLFNWRDEMRAARAAWETLADAASQPKVTEPGWLSSFWPSTTNAGCDVTDPIFIVPVGRAMLALADRIASPEPGDAFELPTGARLAMTDLFANPYLADETGPGGQDRQAPVRRLRDPSKPHDDIHPGAIGIYFNALVHFATLYRQSPEGLPDFEALGPAVSRTLKCIAWDVVASDPRAGVGAAEHC
jgi:hypothetical protein